MQIELKNGESLVLEVTPLILEYFEEYPGGVEQIKKDARGEKDKNGYTRTMYATNQLLYAVIASNYDSPLTYRQAVRLVKLEDVEKIADFVIKSMPSEKKDNTNKKQIRAIQEITSHRI
ncbi:MAG: hypothetical protein J6A89_04150 [Clostridia bacterium]|nr:hypothetical protein [Clostridia bacterium]